MRQTDVLNLFLPNFNIDLNTTLHNSFGITVFSDQAYPWFLKSLCRVITKIQMDKLSFGMVSLFYYISSTVVTTKHLGGNGTTVRFATPVWAVPFETDARRAARITDWRMNLKTTLNRFPKTFTLSVVFNGVRGCWGFSPPKASILRLFFRLLGFFSYFTHFELAKKKKTLEFFWSLPPTQKKKEL